MELLVLQHVDCEGPGLLAEVAGKLGHTHRIVKLYANEPIPALADNTGLIVLGGPMNVYEEDAYPFLRDEHLLLQQAVERDRPILGICLGAQLLAKALGGQVTANPEKEIGFYDIALTPAGRVDPLFARMSSAMPVFQWHGDTFSLPQDSVLLATGEICANQAFRYGRAAYGVQFHLETTPNLIGKWISAYRDELEGVLGVNSGGRLVMQAKLMEWLVEHEGQALFTNFLRLAEQSR